MKKLSFFIVAGLFSSLLFFSSCKKKDTTPAPKTKTELLSQAAWKYKSSTVSGIPYSIQSCLQDNEYNFLAAGTGSMTEGATQCNAGDPTTVSFTWSFQSNETIIAFSTAIFGTNSVNLLSLTESELVISFPYTPPFGPTVTIVVTLIH